MSTLQNNTPLLPPEEKFWKRYSPHHEFPLAGTTSLLAHGLVFGSLFLGGLWSLIGWRNENNRPPSMDVVQVMGGGDGFEGAAGLPGAPGEDGPKSEVAENLNLKPEKTEAVPTSTPTLKDVATAEYEIPEIGVSDELKADIDEFLAEVTKEAQALPKQKTASAKPKIPSVIAAMKGGGGQGGQGGQGGAGGKGTKGFGPGSGGTGRKATDAEIFAHRWRFDLTGSPKEHADKLAAIGVTLAIPNQRGWMFIQDLRRRPVELKPGDIEKYKDAVKWQNKKPESLDGLSRELRLPFVPATVILLLPKDREAKMAQEELRFAQAAGRPPQQIQATWFDFQLRNGQYEPVAIAQQ